MAKKYVDDCGGYKPNVLPKKAAKQTAKKSTATKKATTKKK